MTWQDEITTILRTLINDLGNNPTYSNDRLLQVITVAAKYVQFDINLNNIYIIDVVNKNISPDPSVLNDSIFVSTVALKAACIIDQSLLRTKTALEGIRASLGPAQLQIAGSLTGVKMLLDEGPCATYEYLRFRWDIEEANGIRAILSPFVGNKFDPQYLLRGPVRDRTQSDFYA